MWLLLLAAGMLVRVPTTPADCAQLQDRYGCVPFIPRIFEVCYPQVQCYTIPYEEVGPKVVRVRVDVFGGTQETARRMAEAACASLPTAKVGTVFQCRTGNLYPDAGKRQRIKLVVEGD